MANKHAKTLSKAQQAYMKDKVLPTRPHSKRALVIFLLSFNAGLRAVEIAGLNWGDVMDADGSIGMKNEHGEDQLFIPAGIAKYGSERFIPMHPELKQALLNLSYEQSVIDPKAPIIYGLWRYNERTSPNAVSKMIKDWYRLAGYAGCSSHSGRRTFITQLARRANNHDCSLRDVQQLAGHRDIKATEGYISPSDKVSKMINTL
jgi:integrase/recombinase XerD